MLEAHGSVLAGVDGCRAGWIAAVRDGDGTHSTRIFSCFAELVDALPTGAMIAIDMPIGLPDHVYGGGRGPEQAIRPLLGQRQSSVFSIPSRAAVWAERGPFESMEAAKAAHRRASEIARATSTPPRAIAIQAFFIFPKIREIDELLTPQLQKRVFEVHPELAFWKLNAGVPLETPKKIRGKINPEGMAQRFALLETAGLPRDFLETQPPGGAARDDFLDACACLYVAQQLAGGTAQSFPPEPESDARGLRIAIWA